MENYYENPKYCKKCGKVIPFEKRENSFCNRSCANSYSNSIRVLSEETKKKIANSLKKDKNIKLCKQCGAEKGKCLHPEICSKYRTFKSLSKFGFDLKTIGTLKVYDEFLKVKNILTNEYNNHIDDFLLKEKYNYTSGLANFHKLLKSIGVETKCAKDRIKEAYFLGKKSIVSSNTYICTWHTTWEGKEVYLRSSYELDYAKMLDEQKIKYDVECLHIKYFDTNKNEYRCSIPDFYLIDSNTIVEIKSEYTLNIQNMKDKFKSYKDLGYNSKLILEHKEVDINLI
jgi:hypothetical protein